VAIFRDWQRFFMFKNSELADFLKNVRALIYINFMAISPMFLI